MILGAVRRFRYDRSRSMRFLRTGAWLVAAVGIVATVTVGFRQYTLRKQQREEAVRVAQLHLDHGMQRFRAGSFVEAQEMFRQALRTNPDDWTAPYYVGRVQIELKQFGMAVPYLEKALTLKPEDARILTALGVSYFKLGKVDMARGYFWAALEANPENTEARGLLESMAKLQWEADVSGAPSPASAPGH